MRAVVEATAVDEKPGQQAVYAQMSRQVTEGQEIKPGSVTYDRGAVTNIDLASGRVTFTMSGAGLVRPLKSNGIEDARFVLFQNDDGSRIYYATYTAYDGKLILPQFIETRDYLHFKFITLNGPAVQNKGMALFPRKVNGRYAMLSRQDYENIYVMFSDHLHYWHSTQW